MRQTIVGIRAEGRGAWGGFVSSTATCCCSGYNAQVYHTGFLGVTTSSPAALSLLDRVFHETLEWQAKNIHSVANTKGTRSYTRITRK